MNIDQLEQRKKELQLRHEITYLERRERLFSWLSLYSWKVLALPALACTFSFMLFLIVAGIHDNDLWISLIGLIGAIITGRLAVWVWSYRSAAPAK
tara:strand:+ start:1344 stop:1631 length:288 start_codon:yes stop_codon:yes gene_type:complete